MKRLIYILLWLVPVLSLKAQTLVFLENAETLDFDQVRIPDAQVLKGNVRFRHDNALLYCDSAYFYEQSNSLEAFGHVRFVQGDTLFGYSDRMHYDGNAKFARMRSHVKLVDKKTTLTTDSLNYDRTQDLAWYWTGGQIKDQKNILTSKWGQYTSHESQALFKTDVHLENDRFVMDADTLKYNTKSHVADLVGPTTIIYEEETTITSTLGWYNTENEKSMLLNHSLIVHQDGKTMTGDTIFYDKKLGYGQALRNMELVDSAQHITLYGNYGEMYEKKDSVGSHGYATDSALMVDWSDSAKYTYMHADTLYTEEIPYRIFSLRDRDSLLTLRPNSADSMRMDSIMVWQAPDTIWVDTAYRQIRAFYGVRMYREDMQAVADSSVYNSRDSIMSLFGKPIAWSDNQQIAADHIDIYFRDSTIDYAHGQGNCIAIQQQTSKYYNQMAGKEMFAYIRDNELRQVDVNGNAETVFFPKDEKTGDWIGVNKTQSSFVRMYIEDQKIHHVVFTAETTGTMYPIDELSESETHLSQFLWADHLRPNAPGDVFLHPDRATQTEVVQEETEPEEEQPEDQGRTARRSAKK